MKAIILAAGVGSRLRPMTDKKPKTLIKVNGKPMLGYIIDSLTENGVREIVICTGYKSSQIVNFCENNYPSINFSFVENKEFEETNNMYSLFLAKKHLKGNVILMNADLVFDAGIIGGLVKQKRTVVAVDKGRYLEESMKVIVKNGIIKSISKKIIEKEAYGCSIDIYKIDKKDTNTLILEMNRIININRDRNQWTEVMLDNLFSSGKIVANPFNIGKNRWYEIDNYEDLGAAEVLFNEKIEELKNKKIFFIDRDGTLTIENETISGALDFINVLKKKNRKFFVATNNSSRTPKEHLARFNKIGLGLKECNILVSSASAVAFLKQKKIKKVFWVANKNVSKYFSEEGLKYEEKNPEAILLTYDDEINYQKIQKLTNFVRKGIPYYATHMDVVCPAKDGVIPDIGTFIKIVEMTTGILPNKFFGKPDKSFIDPILKKYGFTYRDAVIIGDRLYTDMKLAENSPITSVLVLTGETKREDCEFAENKIDIIISNLICLRKFI
ncbi:MAG TPA: HAD-IIA family hydrolase [Candidatus Moranbacteria bacterium]|nr:HAD-IIA family hydrolase [Candidatus Moranbacteria bacterium]